MYKQNQLKQLASIVLFTAAVVGVSSCSTAPKVKAQAFAKLKQTRTFEAEMAPTAKAINRVLANFKLLEQGTGDKEKLWKTDWIISQSRDKYIEYKVNGFPRKKYLQTRLKYDLDARSILGGTEVAVRQTEEIERLNEEGASAGWENVSEVDTSRASDLLDQIQNALLSSS